MGKTSQSSQNNWKRPLNKDVMKNGDSGINPGLENLEIRDTDIQNAYSVNTSDTKGKVLLVWLVGFEGEGL